MPNPQMTVKEAQAVDAVLTTHAQGLKNGELVGNNLFPIVPVDYPSGKVIDFGIDDFMDVDTERAPGADTTRIGIDYSTQNYSITEHSLEVAMPYETAQAAQNGPGIDLGFRATNKGMKKILLWLERQQANLARNPNNYDAGHKITLSGTSQWNDPLSTPVVNITNAQEAIRASIGVRPNTLFLSSRAYAALRSHSTVKENWKGLKSQNPNQEMLAEFFEVKKVVVAESLVASTQKVLTDIWGKDAILAYVRQEDPSVEEPSFGYTYTMKGYPFVEEAYFERRPKSWIFPVTYRREPIITCPTGGYLIQGAVA